MQSPPESTELRRDIGPVQATALNVANMVGIGPFVTIPAFIAAMGGPQAMIAWVIAAILVVCDGLVWAELGAALPGSGGTWHFLRRVFHGSALGRLLPFLFIWQFLFSGTLEIASGYIGTMQYVEYALPGLKDWLTPWLPGGIKTLGAISVLLITLLLCRRTSSLAKLAVVLCCGTVLTVLIVIVCGLTHFDAGKLTLPANAWTLDGKWFGMLGAAMTIAVYDYLGYYNICHMGDEVRDPARTIPRAVLWSILIIATVYLTMNISIIAVVPWQEAMESKNIAALFMERLFGTGVAQAFCWLVIWTAVACFFCIKAGYSRIPYAAAKAGDFFPVFARLHPRHGYPWVALLAIGVLSAIFCYFELTDVINAAVTVRILVQFGWQILAIFYIRRHRKDIVLPFRMWLFPVPALIAACGWIFLIATSEPGVLAAAAGVLASGIAVWTVWQWVLRVRQTRQSSPQALQ
jgi:amino acid transporter